MLWGSLLLAWATGGTDHVAPHWFFVPVLLAGGRFGPWGVLTAGLTAGLLAGPLTPADVDAAQAQTFSDWGTRTVFFVVVGLFFAHVLGRTRRSAHQELEGLRLGSELAGAADRGELVLEYQPVVALRGREVIAAEALVRWEHPDRGRVMPDQFIPQSESSGEIHPVGAWVIDEACRQFAVWRRGELDPDGPFRLSVNVSIHQVEDGDLAAVVERALRRHRIPADGLVLELTETAMFQDTEATISKLGALRAAGVRIAMDDFGTGYSSLGYLRRFPVDILKIARDFVVEPELEQSEWVFAHAIVALGQTLGLQIIAEGIEEASQVDRLLQMGCELGQGFHLGAPFDSSTPVVLGGNLPATAIRPASRPATDWVAEAAT